jgi:hypothetical protein
MSILGEVTELAKLLCEVLKAEPRGSGCLALLDLYRALGALIDESANLFERGFALGMDDPAVQVPGRSPEDEWATRVAIRCGLVEGAMREFLSRFADVAEPLEIHDRDLVKRLRFHVDAKLAWFGAFYDLHQVGVVDIPSRRLRRKVVRLASLDEIPSAWRARRVSRPEEELADYGFLLSEEYDLADPHVLKRLISAGEGNVTALAQAHEELAAFIRAHCSLDDLLSTRG